MIEFTKAFKAGDGKMYSSLLGAQEAEIRYLLEVDEDFHSDHDDLFAHWIVENQEKIVDILTTTENSRPKARKANGGTKTRKAKTISPNETQAA